MSKHKFSKNTLLLLFALSTCILSVASGILIINVQQKIAEENYNSSDNIKINHDIISLFPEASQPVYYNSVMIPKVLYVVAEYNGAIGIFDSTQTELIELLNVDVGILPDTDRAYLTNGIKVYSPAELLSVICDYTG